MLKSRMVASAAEARIDRGDCRAAGASREFKHLLSVFCVVNDGAYRDWHLNICSVVSRSIAAFTMPAALSRMFRVKAQVEQRVVVPARSQDNIAPVSTVAAARTAAWDIFFTAKCKAAVPAIAGFYRDCDLIYEQLWKLALGDDVDKLAKLARSRTRTVPGTVANKVSSFPRPTFLARFVCDVPRWRTIIDPPVTTSPENTFMPSAANSSRRPFFELPNPFLCAIASTLQDASIRAYGISCTSTRV